jgi:hypothetical protein
MKLYMFLIIRLSIIRSLFTVHSAMVYVIQVCRQLSRRRICSEAVYKPVWHIPLLSVQWINSWWRTDELSETCRVSCQNKFVKLVHLVGFIVKKPCSVVNLNHLPTLNHQFLDVTQNNYVQSQWWRNGWKRAKRDGLFQENSALLIRFFQTFYSPGNFAFSETVTVSVYLQHCMIANTLY